VRLAVLTQKALVGVNGGLGYVVALGSGDKADDATVDTRRAICRACPTRERAALPLCAVSDWCGEPLVVTADSCGCLLAGKTAVASEGCPQGKWGPVERTTQ